MEYREFRAGSVDETDDGKLILRAAPFGSLTTIGDKNRGGWDEEIAPGCFTKALREGDTVLLCDHDMAKPISRMSAGTLRLAEGSTHLEGDADPVDTTYVRDLRANIKAGNKGGMSIGFVPVKDEWFDDEGRPSNRMVGTRRVLREVKLPEVSIVTNPAYKDTAVYARDESAALLEERAASSVSAADRKSLAAKGHALPDGSYPIPDVAHLHSAAHLAATGHGDVAAAKRLIRKRAKELGVDVKTLEGFGDSDDRSFPDLTDIAAELIDAYNQLPEDLRAEHEDIGRAVELLSASGESREQEPETSTPEDDDADFALRVAFREAEERSRKLGYV